MLFPAAVETKHEGLREPRWSSATLDASGCVNATLANGARAAILQYFCAHSEINDPSGRPDSAAPSRRRWWSRAPRVTLLDRRRTLNLHRLASPPLSARLCLPCLAHSLF